MSFGELCVLVIVAVVIIGPKDLPRVLRKAGQYAGKIRRLASDVRAESGIDEMLRSEGLHKDLAEIRRLAQGDFNSAIPRTERPTPELASTEVVVSRDREYPREGADSHGAIPDTAHMYARGLPKSPLAVDPLYLTGDASAVLPARELSREPANASAEAAPEHAAVAGEGSMDAAPAGNGTPALAPPPNVGHA
jgi:sec-independent protein translocase protein TatB